MKPESLKAAKESLRIESEAIAQIIDYMDYDAFNKAVDAICKADKVITCASGSSGVAAQKFGHSLCCVELNGKFMSPAEAVHGGLGFIKPNDCVIFVSRGGKTVELLPCVSVAKKKGATLIAITENYDSPIAKNADIIVPMKIEKETDRYNVMATSSYVATIAIFDAMLCAIIEETGFKREQFALIHPGGAVGELLNK